MTPFLLFLKINQFGELLILMIDIDQITIKVVFFKILTDFHVTFSNLKKMCRVTSFIMTELR